MYKFKFYFKFFKSPYTKRLVFPGNSAIKNLPALQEMRVPSLGQEDYLDKGMATHSSIGVLCLENSMDRGAWQAMVNGVAELDLTEQLIHT